MAERKIQFINGEIYHVVVRALDGLKLFRDQKDYLRMAHDLFEFNDTEPVSPVYRVSYHRGNDNVTRKDLVTLIDGKRGKKRIERKRKLLVEILAFCLMPNHIHLLIKQIRERGISLFMQKSGGYALYYNQRHQRHGHLFQNKFRAVHVKNDVQLRIVFAYMHTNPLAIIYPQWKENGIEDFKTAENFIENYKWSSYLDYLQKQNKNFPSLTSREFLTEVMGGPKGCHEFVTDWLKYKREIADSNEIVIE